MIFSSGYSYNECFFPVLLRRTWRNIPVWKPDELFCIAGRKQNDSKTLKKPYQNLSLPQFSSVSWRAGTLRWECTPSPPPVPLGTMDKRKG